MSESPAAKRLVTELHELLRDADERGKRVIPAKVLATLLRYYTTEATKQQQQIGPKTGYNSPCAIDPSHGPASVGVNAEHGSVRWVCITDFEHWLAGLEQVAVLAPPFRRGPSPDVVIIDDE